MFAMLLNDDWFLVMSTSYTVVLLKFSRSISGTLEAYRSTTSTTLSAIVGWLNDELLFLSISATELGLFSFLDALSPSILVFWSGSAVLVCELIVYYSGYSSTTAI
jgi:hypothetical protein